MQIIAGALIESQDIKTGFKVENCVVRGIYL